MNSRNRSDLRNVSALVRGALGCCECQYCGSSMNVAVDAYYVTLKCALPSCPVSPTLKMSVSTLSSHVPELRRTHGFTFIHVPPPAITNTEIAAKVAEWSYLCQKLLLYIVTPWLFFSSAAAVSIRALRAMKKLLSVIFTTANSPAENSSPASAPTLTPPQHIFKSSP